MPSSRYLILTYSNSTSTLTYPISTLIITQPVPSSRCHNVCVAPSALLPRMFSIGWGDLGGIITVWGEEIAPWGVTIFRHHHQHHPLLPLHQLTVHPTGLVYYPKKPFASTLNTPGGRNPITQTSMLPSTLPFLPPSSHSFVHPPLHPSISRYCHPRLTRAAAKVLQRLYLTMRAQSALG